MPSEKPEAFAAMIEAMFPDVPKVELFARGARPGWHAWGDQVHLARA
jgi:N6-adenosine-specific RNA methylase IME4